MSVYKKLSEARVEFHSRELKKSGENKFAGYKYFELADFIKPAIAIFHKHGLCAFVSFGAEATMTIVDVENPTDRIVISSPMAEAQLKGCHPVQNLGASQTYLRRYLWVAALEIIEHDAVDSSAGSKESSENKEGADNQSRLGEVVRALEESNGFALLAISKADDQGYRFAFGRLNSKQKALGRELEQKAAMLRMDYVQQLAEAKDAQDELACNQLFDELNVEGKKLVYEMCDDSTKTFIKAVRKK
jgi:hypothetical protein